MVIGEVDGQTAPFLRDRLLDVIDGQGNLAVALDLSAMTFIDSAGLSALVDLDGRARQRGAAFALHNPRPTTARVFEIAGLNQILTIR
jgi:anti-sigma B factor antagonist